jgi:hypothetical protein
MEAEAGRPKIGPNGEVGGFSKGFSSTRVVSISLIKPIFDESPESRKPVKPGNLLAFRKLSPGVGYRDLYYSQSPFQKLRRDLGLEVESVAFNLYALDCCGFKQLVTGLHIGYGSSVENIGNPG